MKDSAAAVTGILLAIIGLGVVAVILSPSANTSGVVTAGGNSFIQAIKCAVAPLTGQACSSGSSIGVSSSSITFGGLA